MSFETISYFAVSISLTGALVSTIAAFIGLSKTTYNKTKEINSVLDKATAILPKEITEVMGIAVSKIINVVVKEFKVQRELITKINDSIEKLKTSQRVSILEPEKTVEVKEVEVIEDPIMKKKKAEDKVGITKQNKGKNQETEDDDLTIFDEDDFGEF